MQAINLDAAKWKSVDDFYDSLLGAVSAPEWHGRSPDALIDSMIWGGINALEPPYIIRVSGTAKLPKDVREAVETAREALVGGRAFRRQQGCDVEVALEIVS